MRKKLGLFFYKKSTFILGRGLLGKYLVRKICGRRISGKIIETEIYYGDSDEGSHAYPGKTLRNWPMFGLPGRLYVYFIYGMYHCLNIVTERKNFPAAILIRALEPKEGIEIMMKNRKMRNLKNLTSGPGKLCEAFGITKRHNNLSLFGNEIFIEDWLEKIPKIKTSPRIGLSSKISKKAQQKKWRFYLAPNF